MAILRAQRLDIPSKLDVKLVCVFFFEKNTTGLLATPIFLNFTPKIGGR